MNLPGFSAEASFRYGFGTFSTLPSLCFEEFGIVPAAVPRPCYKTDIYSGWKVKCWRTCPPRPGTVIAQAPPWSGPRDTIIGCYTQCGLVPTKTICSNKNGACSNPSNPEIFECKDEEGNSVDRPDIQADSGYFECCCGGACDISCCLPPGGGHDTIPT